MSQKRAKPQKPTEAPPAEAPAVEVTVPAGHYLVPAELLQRMHNYIMQCPSGNQPAGAAVEIAFAVRELTNAQNAQRQKPAA